MSARATRLRSRSGRRSGERPACRSCRARSHAVCWHTDANTEWATLPHISLERGRSRSRFLRLCPSINGAALGAGRPFAHSAMIPRERERVRTGGELRFIDEKHHAITGGTHVRMDHLGQLLAGEHAQLGPRLRPRTKSDRMNDVSDIESHFRTISDRCQDVNVV
jgi:hypothetical protein